MKQRIVRYAISITIAFLGTRLKDKAVVMSELGRVAHEVAIDALKGIQGHI